MTTGARMTICSPVNLDFRIGEGVGAVRFSLGRTTTWEELEYVLGLVRAALRRH